MSTITQARMQNIYYHVNPTPHSEKAYQKGDPVPPIATAPTIVGPSGRIVVLTTSIYNKPPFAQGTQYHVYADKEGKTLVRQGTGDCPDCDEFAGLQPGSAVYISPRTIGTMAKILTPEQIAAAGY